MFSYADLEERIPSFHPLRKIRKIVNASLAALDAEFAKLYAAEGRPLYRARAAFADGADPLAAEWACYPRDRNSELARAPWVRMVRVLRLQR